MGKYMTHEQLPFKGKLVKIRLRTYGFNSIVTQPRNEEELLEITPSGTVKLTTTRVDGRQKRKVQIPVEDIVERLIISSRTHEIAYNRRVGNNKRVSLTFEMPEAVKDLLAWYEEQPLFEPGEVNPKPVTKEGVSRTYQITVLYTDKKSASYTGSFDNEGLPGNWADFIGRVAAFFDTESLGEMFNARTFDRVPAKTDDAVFCGVEILGVVGVRYYRCDDDVCLGDVVIVPTPAKKQNLAGQVVELRRCKATAIPKELQKAKDVLYIIKDSDAEERG